MCTHRSLQSRIIALAIALLAVLATPVCAVEPEEILPDAKLEARARALSTELRCLVCQNQSIDDSNAPLAKDLRVVVRERLTKGDTDSEVISYVVARYGEFVLLRPRFGIHTVVLWLAPLALLLGVAFALWRRARSISSMSNVPANSATSPPLTGDEAERLKRILSKDSVP